MVETSAFIYNRMSYGINSKMYVNKYWIDIYIWLYIPLYGFDVMVAYKVKSN